MKTRAKANSYVEEELRGLRCWNSCLELSLGSVRRTEDGVVKPHWDGDGVAFQGHLQDCNVRFRVKQESKQPRSWRGPAHLRSIGAGFSSTVAKVLRTVWNLFLRDKLSLEVAPGPQTFPFSSTRLPWSFQLLGTYWLRSLRAEGRGRWGSSTSTFHPLAFGKPFQ